MSAGKYIGGNLGQVCGDCKGAAPEVPVDHILLEPCRRNTAPCIAYVSWKIKARNPKANIVVTPSDHVVMNVREFARVVTSAMKFTADSDAIVTLGMKANRAETGYGYIEADLSMACPSNKEIYRVDAFREKPDLATAERYLQRNNYFWNAGIFVWNVNTIVNAIRYISRHGKSVRTSASLLLYRQGTGDGG